MNDDNDHTSTPTHPNPLVAELMSRQGQLNLTDTEFARRLGISRTLWGMTRRVQRGVNVTLLRAITRTFPDMDEQVWDYLRSVDK